MTSATPTASDDAAQKRVVTARPAARGALEVRDLILVAVLLAAGAVLKLTLASVLSVAGMKPNFVIAMYALAIIITRPKLGQSLAIGLIAGLMCQLPLMAATPLVNIASELVGALVCGLLIHVPLKLAGKVDASPFVVTFLTTVASGYTFVFVLAFMNGIALPAAVVGYALMVFGTAAFNAVLVQVLVMPLRAVLKR
ncbi:hypothetical protein HLV37_02875 [Eggerthellaceae bacterium zg-1084]|uniref:Uncharacterized protein n=1 Tax=Berryella wangjianweii TaxID=2734634 RepID=A0A6M8J974_9ACTN|nr:hypothetical protein [Berryella wangjianweii]QKF08048.1 hypothetical protein HLV38_05940 [Berryella wangjianweii]